MIFRAPFMSQFEGSFINQKVYLLTEKSHDVFCKVIMLRGTVHIICSGSLLGNSGAAMIN